MEILEGLDLIESLIKEKRKEIDLMKDSLPKMSLQEIQKALKDLDKLDIDLDFLEHSCKRTLKLCTTGEMDMSKVEEEFNEVIDNIKLYFGV